MLVKKYSIGEVAEMCSVSIKTLRYYDQIGLVIPEFRNEESKYRYYSKKQMIKLFIIRQLRKLGFSVKEIKCLLENLNVEEMEDAINNRLEAIDKEIKELEMKKATGENLRERLKIGGDILSRADGIFSDTYMETMENITLEKIPEGVLFYVREIMKNYCNSDVSLSQWIRITDKSTELNLIRKSPIIVTYYAQPLEQFLMKDTDLEFGILVDKVSADGDDFRVFGGFDAVTKIHVGKYSDVVNSHISMIQWINQNGYELAGPISEEFIVSPVDIDNEDEYITKIIMPVRKK
ncbi:MAG: MerR family transcriptional regulator [Anaerovoracaceae bacterium]|nr:MerR family transcriptional regulator [Anaerovoracaceae bacterium]